MFFLFFPLRRLSFRPYSKELFSNILFTIPRKATGFWPKIRFPRPNTLNERAAWAENFAEVSAMNPTCPKLTSEQLDAIREIANIGTGHAVTALATLTDWRIGMHVPCVDIVPLSHFLEILCRPEDEAIGIYLAVEGDAPGHVAFLLSQEGALKTADRLLGQPLGTTKVLGELECSALMELGNIIVSSFLMAISELTGLTLFTTPPAFACDVTASILSSLASMLAATGTLQTDALTIVTNMEQREADLEGFFLYIPESNSLSIFLNALYGERPIE
ncbi:chemotaxis protein CheC, inhibitor of MCP methylation [Chthonomonas calidirosea]|nr:chemotaxis protein CheC, inhibitor of MCP methylation [Chthonomonas calidirosea]